MNIDTVNLSLLSVLSYLKVYYIIHVNSIIASCMFFFITYIQGTTTETLGERA